MAQTDLTVKVTPVLAEGWVEQLADDVLTQLAHRLAPLVAAELHHRDMRAGRGQSR